MNIKLLLIIVLVIIVGVFAFGGGEKAELVIDFDGKSVLNDDLARALSRQVLSLDANASELSWKSARIVGQRHMGTVAITRGGIARDDEGNVTGEFIIDMTTITEDNDNQKFLGHIRSDDFFSIANFPTSKIAIEGVVLSEETQKYTVTAMLTIKDIKKRIQFVADVNFERDVVTMTSSFDIDRTRWGITYDSGNIFKELGEKAIKDEVSYSLNLVFNPVQ